MRKLFVLGVASLCFMMVTGVAFAGQARENCGCGLGTILWEGKSDDSILFQTLQITTNSTFLNNLFGITSGTMECEKPAKFAASEQLMEFASGNMDNLARDIAMGQGESLDTLAELMDVPDQSRGQFDAQLQDNFGSIFITGDENAATILDRIYVVTN
jgi:hypothetical protein